MPPWKDFALLCHDLRLGARRSILSVIREKPRLQVGLWNVPQGMAEDRVKGSLSKFLMKRDRKGLFFTAGKRPAKLRMASTSPQHVEAKAGECPEHFSGTQGSHPGHEASATSY